MELSLLAPVRFADDTEEMFVVHRWTAGALARRTSEDERTAAHQAAAYWCWRAGHCPQPRQQAIEYLLEARHHLLALGDLTKLYEVSSVIIAQLNTWGAWEWEERLTRETLAWMRAGAGKLDSLIRVALPLKLAAVPVWTIPRRSGGRRIRVHFVDQGVFRGGAEERSLE